MSDKKEIKLRQSIIILFALIELKHEMTMEFGIWLNKRLEMISNVLNNMSEDQLHEQMAVFIKLRDTHLSVFEEIEDISELHPLYKKDIAYTCLLPYKASPSVFTVTGANKWSKRRKISELNFLFSLLCVITGPKSKFFRSSTSILDHRVILEEALQCTLDFEEVFGESNISKFYHACVVHFKSVKSTTTFD